MTQVKIFISNWCKGWKFRCFHERGCWRDKFIISFIEMICDCGCFSSAIGASRRWIMFGVDSYLNNVHLIWRFKKKYFSIQWFFLTTMHVSKCVQIGYKNNSPNVNAFFSSVVQSPVSQSFPNDDVDQAYSVGWIE